MPIVAKKLHQRRPAARHILLARHFPVILRFMVPSISFIFQERNRNHPISGWTVPMGVGLKLVCQGVGHVPSCNFSDTPPPDFAILSVFLETDR